MRELSLGYSPCPNDTHIFYAMAQGRIDLPFRLREPLLADVEMLNRLVMQGALDVSKLSAHTVLHILDKYALLRSGGAIGRGCGPLVVSKVPAAMEDLRDAKMAVPGKLTTAHLLLRLQGTHRGACIPMQFDRIMPAVSSGEVDAGVIIHEGRFTFGSYGLHLVLDLGRWWEIETGLPLPLGAIAVRRELGPDVAAQIEDKIRESILYARANPAEAWPYIARHAQEMEPEVIRRHIETFVNDFSIDAGEEGERAFAHLLEAASGLEGKKFDGKSLFLR
ncbi:MAG: 1,4-dihydroxy-6-naphthoate synthase [Desulfobacteraceae bacterium]|nr:1,4-dihydroxy-6-naphthoate synthase [Desulfobacteraceae bacterium]